MARKQKKKIDQTRSSGARADKNRAALLGIGRATAQAEADTAASAPEALPGGETVPAQESIPASGASPALKSPSAGRADGFHAWRVVGAAVKGISHERTGAPCQDAQDFRILPDGTLIIALADGAGSARFSDQGARLAVEEALRFLSDDRAFPCDSEEWEALLRETAQSARQVVLNAAEEAGGWARDYACTLTVAVAACEHLVVGQIGDGAVVALDESAGGELVTVTRLQRGEYANETHFLIEQDALNQLTIQVMERPVTALAVMSDGLIRLALKLPSEEPHTPFFQPLFGFVRSIKEGQQEQAAGKLAEFLSSERVNARTDDDKSLVLAARVMINEKDLVKSPEFEETSSAHEDPSQEQDQE